MTEMTIDVIPGGFAIVESERDVRGPGEWIVRGQDADDPRWMMWEMARQAWLDGLRRKSGADNTVQAYTLAMQQFVQWSPVSLWDVSAGIAQEFARALERGLAQVYWGPVVVNTRTGRVHHPGRGCAPSEQYAQRYDALEAALEDGYTVCSGCASSLGQGQPLSRASVNQKISALASFFQFVQARYVFRTPDGREVALWPADRANPFGTVERAEIDVYARAQYPSTEEVQAILGAINTETERGARDFALLYTFAVTCRRAREILSLTWGQIEPAADGQWKFRYVYKGGKTKVAPLQNDVYQAMVHYLKRVGRYPLKAEELVFVTLDGERAGRVLDCDPAQAADRQITNGQANRMLKVYARRAGVDERKAHLHALRHAGARQRYQSAKKAGNADLLEISQFLGHSSVAVTQIYAGQVLDDPGDPAGAAAAAAFKPKRKRGRPRKAQVEQLFDPQATERRR